MWNYTDKVLDHFRNPHNVGEIENPDGVGEVGSMACGDALKLTFKLNDKKRIADVKFKTFGCASAIASSSALTEIIKGKTLEEAERVTNRDIAEYLGGLPEQKMHCSVMGREALEAAIANYRTGASGTETIDGSVICTCFGVTDKEIERVVKDNDLTTVQQVTDYCKAGGGCGKCRPDIASIIAKIRHSPPPPPNEDFHSGPEPARMTSVQKIHRIEEVIDGEVRPQLQKDGGDIELIDVAGDRVIVALRGMCAKCNVAQFTLHGLLERKLREFVSPDLTVEEEQP
ncbi:MAG: Fe-S cluster assembly protein NifU [Kiritimatiellia bacterium]